MAKQSFEKTTIAWFILLQIKTEILNNVFLKTQLSFMILNLTFVNKEQRVVAGNVQFLQLTKHINNLNLERKLQ